MAEENRFSDLMGGLDNDDEPVTETKPKKKTKGKAKSKKSTVKSSDPDYKQIGLYLPKELHKRMKIGAAMTGVEISDLGAQAIELWLAKHTPNI